MHWLLRPARVQKKPSKEEGEEMQDEKMDLEAKKEIAKIAMTTSLGATVFTAPFLKGSKTMKNIHTGAGVLFVGFSLWHHFLYQPDKRKKKKVSLPSSSRQALLTDVPYLEEIKS